MEIIFHICPIYFIAKSSCQAHSLFLQGLPGWERPSLAFNWQSGMLVLLCRPIVGSSMAIYLLERRLLQSSNCQLALSDYYSASCYEEDVLKLLDKLFKANDYVLLTGGSMLYIDAVCKGIDEIPTITDEIRREVVAHYEKVGLAVLCEELKVLDPVYYAEVDLNNHKRVIHAIEICRQTGGRYSDLRTRRVKSRPFRIIKIGLIRPREELFERISQRVEQMIADGLVDEARRVYPYRHLNSLNTVGYKELFAYFDGKMTLEEAVEKIKRNTRVYSKKQVTWYKKDLDMKWFSPDDKDGIIAYIDENSVL